MTTALGVPPNAPACEPGATGGNRTLLIQTIGPGAGALVSALSGMLRSDIEIRNAGETMTSEILARAVLARGTTGQFILPQQKPAEEVSKRNPVVKTLCRLGFGRTAVEEAISRYGEKLTDAEKRKKAQLSLVATRYDEWMGRLTKSDNGAIPSLATVYMQSTLFNAGTNILRVWVEKSGGTLLTRRNLWTTLGAPAVGVTGGIVVSFTKINAETGEVGGAGFLYCNTELASLRRVHASQPVRANCIPSS